MSSLLQTKEWAALRQDQGWQAHWVDDVLILQKKLFFGKSFLYAPEVKWEKLLQSQVIASLAPLDMQQPNTKGIAASPAAPRNDSIIFFRLEILDKFDQKIIDKLKENNFVKAFEEIQPEYRQIIDISKSEDEILSQMKEKGRYNIRVAQRHGCKSEIQNLPDRQAGPKSEIDVFYNLYQETAKRDGFEIRPKAYFEKLFEILSPKNYIELLIAKYENKPIAAEIVTYYNKTASYLYGASGNDYRNVMAPYLLHWEAIKRAKEKGCKFYDLLAVDPEDGERLMENGNRLGNQQLEKSNHKYAGIGRFKRQFGGRTIHLVGSYDLIFQPGWYKIFKIAEKMRRK